MVRVWDPSFSLLIGSASGLRRKGASTRDWKCLPEMRLELDSGEAEKMEKGY